MEGERSRWTAILVEDHDKTRNAIEAILHDACPEVRLVGSFGHAAEALRFVESNPAPDVALVDIGLPDVSGIEFVTTLVKSHPATRAVMLTVHMDESSVLRAIDAGAHGYLLKDEAWEKLPSALREAAEGHHPISSRAAGFLLKQHRIRQSVALSKREEELARLLARGESYAGAAEIMGVRVSTIQSHVKNLYRKLNVHSRHELRTWVRACIT